MIVDSYSPSTPTRPLYPFRFDPYAAHILPSQLSTPWEQFMDATIDEVSVTDASTVDVSPNTSSVSDVSTSVEALLEDDFNVSISGKGARRAIHRVTPPRSASFIRHSNPLNSKVCDARSYWDESSPARHIVTVRFKCRRGKFATQTAFKSGVFVVCDGDNGLDIGEVVDCQALPSPRRGEVKQVLQFRAYRVINSDEATLYSKQLEQIEIGCKRMLRKLCELSRAGVRMEAKYHQAYWDCIQNMEFEDVEVQADFAKIYIFFRTDRALRFKPLTETLYSIYGCRIWLHQLDRDSAASTPNTSSRQ
jgi:hypothetical protein